MTPRPSATRPHPPYIFVANFSLTLVHINWHFSCQDGDGQVEAAELGARQDLEAVGRRQGRVPGRRGVCAGDAPHPSQDQRARSSLRATFASRAPLQTQLRSLSSVNQAFRCYSFGRKCTALKDPGHIVTCAYFEYFCLS